MNNQQQQQQEQISHILGKFLQLSQWKKLTAQQLVDEIQCDVLIQNLIAGYENQMLAVPTQKEQEGHVIINLVKHLGQRVQGLPSILFVGSSIGVGGSDNSNQVLFSLLNSPLLKYPKKSTDTIFECLKKEQPHITNKLVSCTACLSVQCKECTVEATAREQLEMYSEKEKWDIKVNGYKYHEHKWSLPVRLQKAQHKCFQCGTPSLKVKGPTQFVKIQNPDDQDPQRQNMIVGVNPIQILKSFQTIYSIHTSLQCRQTSKDSTAAFVSRFANSQDLTGGKSGQCYLLHTYGIHVLKKLLEKTKLSPLLKDLIDLYISIKVDDGTQVEVLRPAQEYRDIFMYIFNQELPPAYHYTLKKTYITDILLFLRLEAGLVGKATKTVMNRPIRAQIDELFEQIQDLNIDEETFVQIARTFTVLEKETSASNYKSQYKLHFQIRQEDNTLLTVATAEQQFSFKETNKKIEAYEKQQLEKQQEQENDKQEMVEVLELEEPAVVEGQQHQQQEQPQIQNKVVAAAAEDDKEEMKVDQDGNIVPPQYYTPTIIYEQEEEQEDEGYDSDKTIILPQRQQQQENQQQQQQITIGKRIRPEDNSTTLQLEAENRRLQDQIDILQVNEFVLEETVHEQRETIKELKERLETQRLIIEANMKAAAQILMNKRQPPRE